MIISCVRCGYARGVKYEGTPEEIEQDVHETIEEGWRYDKHFDGYVCPNCKEGHDPLHELICGKVKKESKSKSYKKLMFDMCRFLNELGALGYWNEKL